MAGVGAYLVAIGGYVDGGRRIFIWACAALDLCFVTFMISVDVPMYVGRWRRSRRDRTSNLSLREGLQDALHRRVITRDWSHWRPEVAWLSGYFSVAVWLSLSLVHFTIP